MLSRPVIKNLDAEGKFGHLTPQKHWDYRESAGIFLMVFIDGEDVTNHCFESDDREGYVGLYKLNAEGHKYVDFDTMECAREWRTGNVRYVPRPNNK